MKYFISFLLVLFLSTSIFSQDETITITTTTITTTTTQKGVTSKEDTSSKAQTATSPQTEVPVIPTPQTRSMGLGLSVINLESGTSSQLGFSFDINYDWFYMSMAFNGARGTGEQLDFRSSETYMSDRVSWYLVDVGYNIYFNNNNSWVTPFVGLIFTSNIYQDPIGWDTYFMDDEICTPSVGILFTQRFDKVLLSIGTGTSEIFKLSVGYAFGF